MVLSDVVEKTYFFDVGVCGKDKIHDRVRVEKIGGSGDVCAGSLKRIYKSDENRVGNGCEHNGSSAVLGGSLHCHCNGGRNADHKVYLVCLKVGNDLGHKVCVRVAVVRGNIKHNILFGAYFGEALFNVFDYLVEGRVVDIVADADGVGLFAVVCGGLFTRRAGGKGESRENGCEDDCCKLSCFHFLFSFLSLSASAEPLLYGAEKTKNPVPQYLQLLGQE